MKLGYTILYVRDVRATLAFYSAAFGFRTRFIVPGGDYGELEMSSSPSSTGNNHAPAPKTTLAFAAEDFVQNSLGGGTGTGTGTTATAAAATGITAFRPNRLQDPQPAGAQISFVVGGDDDDNDEADKGGNQDEEEKVRAAFKKAVSAGAVVVREPLTKPWGQVVAYVRDLNGFLVEICSPVGGGDS